MPPVNIFEAKNTLSRLVDAVESGTVKEVIIARNGKPAARLVAIEKHAQGPRIGVARGKLHIPDPDPAEDAAVTALLTGAAAKRKRKPK